MMRFTPQNNDVTIEPPKIMELTFDYNPLEMVIEKRIELFGKVYVITSKKEEHLPLLANSDKTYLSCKVVLRRVWS